MAVATRTRHSRRTGRAAAMSPTATIPIATITGRLRDILLCWRARAGWDFRLQERLELRIVRVREQARVDLARLVVLPGCLVQARRGEERIVMKRAGDRARLRERLEGALRVAAPFLGMPETGEGLLPEGVGRRRAGEVFGVRRRRGRGVALLGERVRAVEAREAAERGARIV